MRTKSLLRFVIPVAAAAALGACSSEDPTSKTQSPAAPAPAELPAGANGAAKPKPKIEIKDQGYKGPGPLTAFADGDETVGTAPLTVKLNVDVIDNTGNPPFKYTWDFGDATEFSTEKSPSHVYKIPGSFRASVIITDSKGEVDQDYVDVSVNEDVEYVITPEQLREAMPPEEVMKRAKEMQEKAAGKAPGGAPAPGAAQPPADAKAPSAAVPPPPKPMP